MVFVPLQWYGEAGTQIMCTFNAHPHHLMHCCHERGISLRERPAAAAAAAAAARQPSIDIPPQPRRTHGGPWLLLNSPSPRRCLCRTPGTLCSVRGRTAPLSRLPASSWSSSPGPSAASPRPGRPSAASAGVPCALATIQLMPAAALRRSCRLRGVKPCMTATERNSSDGLDAAIPGSVLHRTINTCPNHQGT